MQLNFVIVLDLEVVKPFQKSVYCKLYQISITVLHLK